jgi:NAD(P)-dependent dehydrogenase (short-subunit alcohol dehydrogenase family)
VVVLSRNSANFEPLVQEINSSGGQALGISTDVTDSTSVTSAFEKISQQYPGVPLAAAVFNPSGGFARKPFLELTEEEFSQGFENQG